MLPSQPAFVLTVVDHDTTEARKYNVSVARGLITSLNRFTDDDFSAVFGVVCKSHLDSWDTFQSKLKTLAHSCSRFVTFDSLYISEGKYDKLITSFWASVAKVEPGDQFPDAERINFLTKEQCTVLLENMNSKYVFVLTLPKCGGTTLMLEVARRLQNFLPTYLIVKSVEDKSKYRCSCKSVSTTLISESPAITHVLDNNCESERAAVTESILPLHDDQTIKITWTFCSDFIRPQIMDEILDLFGSYRHVLLVGSAGEGKSVTGLLLLEHFRSRGIRVLHATSAAKMMSAVQNAEETFIFCDDVFGKFRWGNHSALEYIISSLKLTSRDIDDITEDGLPCLIVAANQNNVEVCKVLIKHDVEVYIADPRMGANALHWAAAAGHYDGVEVLSRHISLERESNGGVTPLFVAAENGHLGVFKLLLRKGAVINKKIKSRIVSLTNPRNEGRALVKQLNVSDEGFTPLHVASYEGHLDIVELLITEGADANLKADLGPPVAFAAKANDMCIFRLFLSDDRVAFSDVISAAYEYGRTAMLKEAVLHKRSKANDIIKATLQGNLETVKELLEESEEGLSSHIEGYSLLHLAAALNHGDIVDELLQRKIEVNKSSEGGFTALHGASITGSSSVVESLIRREADVDQLANGFGPLHFASMYGNTNTARFLIQHQANIHLKGYHQWSPLHVASIHNQPDLVRLLLENNADVEALSEDLSTPLLFASYLNNMDIADILLDHGADLHPRGMSYHPLLGTALLGHPEAVNNLLQRGAKVNHVSAVGVSALHGAAYMGAMDVLECLLENEADPNLKLFEGISPEEKSKIASHVEQWCKSTPGKDINLRRYDGGSALHMAVDMGYTDMVGLLLKSGADPNLRNMNNETAIDIAREKKHSGILRLLESS
ncbi:ankyrin-3-like [Haliotis rubra]|uniref:ankyrin-3-like n=1 Tax=Haliotis rubra TaxID=36100 RepID=UPI001EE55A3E|nr:ankyrin-3-like [Haliotis rubra]